MAPRKTKPNLVLNLLDDSALKQAVTTDSRAVLAIAHLLNGRHGEAILREALSFGSNIETVTLRWLRENDGTPNDIADNQPAPVTAPQILTAGAEHIAARAVQRDCLNGERSMARTVKAFNAMFGTHLTEVQGWQFMVILKMARASAGGHNADDYEDGAAYFALAGEAADADNREFEKHFGPDKSN